MTNFTPIDSTLGSVSEKIVSGIHKISDGRISQDTLYSAVPIAAAVGTGITGVMLIDTLDAAVKFAAKAIKNVVTGFGYFESIPLIGNVFSTFGKCIDRLGEISGPVLAAVGSFAAYRLFKRPIKTYDLPTNEHSALDGTGRHPMPSEYRTMSVARTEDRFKLTQQVPVGPAPFKPAGINLRALSTEEQAKAEGLTFAELKQKRIDALKDHDLTKERAYQALMGDENQKFENRIQLIKDAKAYSTGPRTLMIDALVSAGLDRSDADTIVVKAPALRSTIYPGRTAQDDHPGGNGVSGDGNMPEILDAFCRKIENYYGKGFIKIGDRAYADLSLTERMEFAEKALKYVRSQYDFFEARKYTTRERASEVRGTSYMAKEAYDYSIVIDRSSGFLPRSRTDTSRWGSTHYPSGVKQWADEHTKFLKPLNKDIFIPEAITHGHSTGSTQGLGIRNIKQGFDGYETLLNHFKQALRESEENHNGEITKFKQNAQRMEQSLNMIKEHGIAMIGVTSNTTLEVRDMRGISAGSPGNGKAARWKWIGSHQGNSFTVTALERDAHRIALDKPITVQLDTGKHIQAVLTEMDVAAAKHKTTKYEYPREVARENIRVAQAQHRAPVYAFDSVAEGLLMTLKPMLPLGVFTASKAVLSAAA